MTLWLLLNSFGLAVVGVVLYLLLRQMGFVLQRVGQVGARGTAEGPRVGENLAHYMPELTRDFGSGAKLIVFGADSCAICAQIRSGAEALSKTWQDAADILLVYDCLNETDQAPFRMISTGLFLKRDCDLRTRLGASFVPFAIVTDPEGTVVGKGLVNEIGHLESLLELQQSKSKAQAQEVRDPALERGAQA